MKPNYTANEGTFSKKLQQSIWESIGSVEDNDKMGWHSQALNGLIELIPEIKSFGISNITDPETIKLLIRMCNKYACSLLRQGRNDKALDLLECAKLLASSAQMKNQTDLDYLKATTYNNLAIYCHQIENRVLAVKFLKNAMQHDSALPSNARAICYNNIASLNLKILVFDKALKYSRAAVSLVEEDVYTNIKTAGSQNMRLKENPEFMRNLQVLLLGYLISAKSLEEMKQSNDLSNVPDGMPDERTLYSNGEKISKKFNGTHHLLTLKFQKCLQRFEDKTSTRSSVRVNAMEKATRLSNLQESSIDKGNGIELEQALHEMSPAHIKKTYSREYIIKKGSHSNFKSMRAETGQSESAADTEGSEFDNYRFMASSLGRKPPSRKTRVSYRKFNSSLDRPKSKGSEFEGAIKAFLKTQLKLEDRITKRLEEKFKLLQKIDQDHQPHKYQELEEQILRLKAENELNQKIKFEKELELERLRLRKASESSLPFIPSYSHVMGAPQFYNPAYLPYPPNFQYPQVQPTDDGNNVNGMPLNILQGQQPMLGGVSHPGNLNQFPQRSRSANPSTNITQNELFDQEEKKTEQNGNGLNKETSGGANNSIASKPKPLRIDMSPILNESPPKNQTSAPLSHHENGVKVFKEPRDNDGGSLTNINTPKLSNGLNTSIVNQLGGRPQSRTHLDDSEIHSPFPIYKTDTFGPGGLKNLMSDLKRPSVTQPQSTNATGGGIPATNFIGENEAPLIQHKNKTENTSLNELKGPSSAFSGALQLIVEESPNKAQKGYLSPTGEETESHELSHSGRLGTNNFDDAAKKESIKSLTSQIADPKQAPQQQNKLNTTLQKLVLDFEEDSGDEKNFIKRDDSFLLLNPTDDVLESPKPCDLLDHPELLLLPNTASITKKCFEFSSSQVYKLECILERFGFDMRIKVILSTVTPGKTPDTEIATEVIKMKDIRKVLKHVEYQDVMPLTTSLKSIKSFSSFMKYCFVPFVWICQDKPIELRAKAKGLLDDELTHLFFGEGCIVGLYYLSETNFRVVLTNLNTGVSFRIEVNLDDSSFNKFFELHSDTPVENYSEVILQTTDILEDEDADADELKEVEAIVKRAENVDEVREEIQVCKFKGQNEEKAFVDSLMDTLIEIETFLGALGYDSFDKITAPQTTKFTKLRYFQEGKKRNVAFMTEQPETEKYRVHMKNFFQTYAPDGVKIQAEGYFEYNIDSFCHEFGVDYYKMDLEDRMAFCSLVTDCFELKTHDKPIDEEDRDSYEANPIIHTTVDNGCFYRIFKGTQYKFPATFTLVGVRGYPVGVRATIFNPDSCKESGVFMFLEPSCWKKVPKQLKPGEKKKRTKKYVGLPMIEEYNLAPILKGYGFKIIDDYVAFESSASRVRVAGVRSMRGYSYVDSLENAITIQGVIRYLKKNTDLFEGLLK